MIENIGIKKGITVHNPSSNEKIYLDSLGGSLPSNSFGNNGDFYRDISTGDCYLKVSGVWQSHGVTKDIEDLNFPFGSLAVGRVNADGTIRQIFNSSVIRTGVGTYNIVFNSPTIDGNYPILITTEEATQDDISFKYFNVTNTGFSVRVTTQDDGAGNGVPLDCGFSFDVRNVSGTLTPQNDHGALSGLSDDDHPQYLNRSGVNPMVGPLNMGNQVITNSGLINGVSIVAHASRHLPNGVDPLSTDIGVTVGTNFLNGIGNANSFARSNHTHKVELQYFNVAWTDAPITTTSTTLVLVPGVIISNIPTGTYIVRCLAITNKSATGLFQHALFLNSTVVPDSTQQQNVVRADIREVRLPYIMELPLILTAITNTIELRWSIVSGGGTMTNHSAYLSLLRVT